jgi:hypothetical protein
MNKYKPAWRRIEQGDQEPYSPNPLSYYKKKTFVNKAGDVFTGKDGRKWERYLKKDGTLGVKPAV